MKGPNFRESDPPHLHVVYVMCLLLSQYGQTIAANGMWIAITLLTIWYRYGKT
jgi:hypothetical protein